MEEVNPGCAERTTLENNGQGGGSGAYPGNSNWRTDAACPQDLDGDGLVEAFDLAIVLGSWGPCEGCSTDFNGDNVVNAFDLAQVLGAWGMCP